MAVRDFSDADGTGWRVWAVSVDALQPRTAAEDYLGEYGEGWLCFESATERRRLAGVPAGWEQFPVSELQALLGRAVLVPTRRTSHLEPPEADAR
jgi:hypothetical protein